MAIFIAEFREKYHLTQAELAVELNVSPSLIGKVENHKRKLPVHAQKLLDVLEQKYAVENSSSDTSETKTLLDEIKQQTTPGMIGQVEMYLFDCKIEEIKLQKKLKKMNQQLKMYESMLQMATEQLKKASPEDLLTEHFKNFPLKNQRRKKRSGL